MARWGARVGRMGLTANELYDQNRTEGSNPSLTDCGLAAL